jgi:hypothetical protein
VPERPVSESAVVVVVASEIELVALSTTVQVPFTVASTDAIVTLVPTG